MMEDTKNLYTTQETAEAANFSPTKSIVRRR